MKHQESHTENIIVFVGAESPTTSSFSPAQLHHHYSNTNVRHRIFSELRQELLLAESVQRDILWVCEESFMSTNTTDISNRLIHSNHGCKSTVLTRTLYRCLE